MNDSRVTTPQLRGNGSSTDGSAADTAHPREALSGQPAPEPAPAAPSGAGPDPFDPAYLRLSGDYGATVGVQKALLAIPVRKPDKSWFVRVHPEPAYRLTAAVVELKEDREIYLVDPALRPDLAAEPTFGPMMLFLAINRQGVLFFWPVRPPTGGGRVDGWNRSALEAVELAAKGWVRVAANLSLGGYDVFRAVGQLTEPEWPTLPLGELLRVAFKDRHVTGPDHPVLRKLRGEA